MKRDRMQETKNDTTSDVTRPRRLKRMKSKKDDVPDNKRSVKKARKTENKKLELQCRCSPSHLHNMMVQVKEIISDLCMSKLNQTPFFHFLDFPRILVSTLDCKQLCLSLSSILLGLAVERVEE
ncbi:hypothetical protein Droror1_Dr00021818 [Drosera rotundifolia]